MIGLCPKDKLLVFIGWSGPRSHAVAEYIKEWLPKVVCNAVPWLSSEDIPKGRAWRLELEIVLRTRRFGLFVLTADNKDRPWVNFEAGAIWGANEENQCCTLLCDLERIDVSEPLETFQSTKLRDKKDMFRLIKNVNNACGTFKVEEDRLSKLFSRSWDEFYKKVGEAISAKSTVAMPVKAKPTDREMLEKVLATEQDSANEQWKWLSRLGSFEDIKGFIKNSFVSFDDSVFVGETVPDGSKV